MSDLFATHPRPWSIDDHGFILDKFGDQIDLDGFLRAGDGSKESNQGQRLRAEFLAFVNAEPRP
jgi:hypothetical protein